jgi:hypothetical protein
MHSWASNELFEGYRSISESRPRPGALGGRNEIDTDTMEGSESTQGLDCWHNVE